MADTLEAVSRCNADRRVIALYSTPTSRPTLALHDLETGSTETLAAAEYGSIDPKEFVDAQHIRYESFDGLSIPALLYVPRDLAAGTTCPAMVYVHGGTFRSGNKTSPELVDEANTLAKEGYVVLTASSAEPILGSMPP